MITKIHKKKHRKNTSPNRTCLRHRGSCKPKNYTCNVQPFNVHPSPRCVGERVKYIYSNIVCILNIPTKAIRFHPKTLQKKEKEPPLLILKSKYFFSTNSGSTKTGLRYQGFGAGQWQDCGHSNRGGLQSE